MTELRSAYPSLRVLDDLVEMGMDPSFFVSADGGLGGYLSATGSNAIVTALYVWPIGCETV
jgi:hypothetical protein